MKSYLTNLLLLHSDSDFQKHGTAHSDHIIFNKILLYKLAFKTLLYLISTPLSLLLFWYLQCMEQSTMIRPSKTSRVWHKMAAIRTMQPSVRGTTLRHQRAITDKQEGTCRKGQLGACCWRRQWCGWFPSQMEPTFWTHSIVTWSQQAQEEGKIHKIIFTNNKL